MNGTEHHKRLTEENSFLRAKIEELEQRSTEMCYQWEARCRTLSEAFDGVMLIKEGSSEILEATGVFLPRLGHEEKDCTSNLRFPDLLFDNKEVVDLSILVGSNRELRFARKNGLPLEAEVRAVYFPSDEHSIICLLIQDISERKHLEHSLRHEATHDHLTNLPNRRLFADRIQQEISYHLRKQKTLAIMVLDLDNFKMVNDTLGHRVGDALLRDFANRLRMTVREYDVVARFGGDEFQIGLIDTGSRENVAYVARKLLDIFNDPFRVEGHCINYVTGSIGIAIYPGDGEDAETLFEGADAALYESKRKGKRQFQFFRAACAGKETEV